MEHEGGRDCNATDGTSGNKHVQSLAQAFKAESDAKYHIVDIQTPLNAFMSGQYKRSNAYYTIRNHLPVILTRVLDSLTRDKNEIIAQFGENAREELKIVIGLISRLKYELQTDKPFQHFTGDEADREMWNNFIDHLPDDARTFYRSCWMHSECYLYRKLYSFVENSIFLKEFDYFRKAKEHALTRCQDAILALSKYTRRTENSMEMFSELLKLDLWSNRNDLSDDEEARLFNMKVLEDVMVTNEYIIVNNVADVWNCLSNKKTDRQYVDFVLDNAGYELFTDFILAEYMIENGLADKVRFHVKAHPWFVNDITARDFHWTLKFLSDHPDYIISLIGQKFVQFLKEGKFELATTSHFWTAPQAFHSMRNMELELYKTLQESKLIIFKGDLNYRGFIPSNLCALRTVKSEVICGLPGGVSEDLFKKDPQWMFTGNYGIIQFVDGSREFGY
ncbi:hypothetical protein ACLKA7_013400 [Drosophila subpalustris]